MAMFVALYFLVNFSLFSSVASREVKFSSLRSMSAGAKASGMLRFTGQIYIGFSHPNWKLIFIVAFSTLTRASCESMCETKPLDQTPQIS